MTLPASLLIALLTACTQGRNAPPPDAVVAAVPVGPPVLVVQAPDRLVIQEGHRDIAAAVDWSADGRFLATGGDGGGVKLWDAAGVAVIRDWVPRVARIRDVRFNPGSTLLAAADEAGAVHIFDLATGDHVSSFDVSGARRGSAEIEWSPAGDQIAVTTANRVVLLDPVTGAEDAVLKGNAPSARSLSWHPDGERLALGGSDGTTEIWDVFDEARIDTLSGAEDALKRVAWRPDGGLVAVGYGGTSSADGGFVQLRDPVTKRVERRLSAGERRLEDLAWSPDGMLLAAGQANGVSIWDVRTGELKAPQMHNGVQVRAVAFGPGGSEVAAVDVRGGINVWTVASGTPRVAVPGMRDTVLDVSARGGRIAAAACDGVRLWKGADFLLLKGHEGCVTGVDLTRDGSRLASVGADGRIVLWDTSNGAQIAAIEEEGVAFRVVAFRPDGARIAAGGAAGDLRLYDGKTLQLVTSRTGHGHDVRALAYSHDGKRLVSGGGDSRLFVWDEAGIAVDMGEQDGPVRVVAWSPDGTAIAVVTKDSGAIRVLDAKTGAVHSALKGPAGSLTALAWRESGALVAGDDAGAVWRWIDGVGAPIEGLPRVPVADLAPMPGGVLAVAGMGVRLLRPDGAWADLRVVAHALGPAGLVVTDAGRFYGTAEAVERLRSVAPSGRPSALAVDDPRNDPGVLAPFLQ